MDDVVTIIIAFTVIGSIVIPIISFIMYIVCGSGDEPVSSSPHKIMENWYDRPPAAPTVTPAHTQETSESSSGITIEDVMMHEVMDAVWKS